MLQRNIPFKLCFKCEATNGIICCGFEAFLAYNVFTTGSNPGQAIEGVPIFFWDAKHWELIVV